MFFIKKIGIYGGSFNPPHNGHLKLVRSAADRLSLSKVIITPSFLPPHKKPVDFASGEERLEMCRLAFGSDPRFEISDLEIERGGKSYTIDTVRMLKSIQPDAEFYLIIGSDMLESFRSWFYYEEILQRVFLCAASRKKDFVPDFSVFSADERKKIIYLDTPPFELSSEEIRALIKSGGNTGGLLNSEVAGFISLRGLYT